ncbi:Transglutaminase-like superfamily protein [Spongiibacter sp. IMCC21906]|nr:Transglutaminase-like superfamily protein [Spongiibacter sp. IMCC21906]
MSPRNFAYYLFCYLFYATVLTACAGPAPALNTAQGDQWQAVSYDGSRIGHRQIRRIQSAALVTTTQWLRLKLLQPGAGISDSETRLEYIETRSGEAISITKQLKSPSANYRMTAVVDGDTLLVKPGRNKSDNKRYPLPANFLLPEGQRLAMHQQTGERRSLSYSSWSFSDMAFEDISLTAFKIKASIREENQKTNADYHWEIHRTVNNDTNPTTTILYTDADFYPLAEQSQSAGKAFAIETCNKDCALSDFVPQTHVYRQIIRSPYRISEQALSGKIRYQLIGPNSIQPPITRDQKVEKIENGWQLTVCNNCNANEPSTSPAQLSKALQSNYWLAADNRVFKSVISQRLDKKHFTAAEKMQFLTRLVTRHMSEVADYTGYATALEAWQNQTGDCTEHALLLATLGKAAGIPTRVVIGLAYNNDRFLGRRFVFVPHAWVQAWTGEGWQNYDSALGKFNAGYITLGLSQGEPAVLLKLNEQLHQLELRSAVQLKSR